MSTQPRFVHLRTHTDFSMIDGIVKVKPLVKACAANNMVALALTDFTNFCGVVRFYGETLSSGIKPIIGADVHVKSELCGEELFTLTLLAKNNEGYKNIAISRKNSLKKIFPKRKVRSVFIKNFFLTIFIFRFPEQGVQMKSVIFKPH